VEVINLFKKSDAIKSALSTESEIKVFHQAVDKVPRSGDPDDLYEMFNLNASSLQKLIMNIIN